MTRSEYFDARNTYLAAYAAFLVTHIRLSAQESKTAAIHARDVTNPAAGLHPDTPITLNGYRVVSGRPRPTPPRLVIEDADRALEAVDSLLRLAGTPAARAPETTIRFLRPILGLYPEETLP